MRWRRSKRGCFRFIEEEGVRVCDDMIVVGGGDGRRTEDIILLI